MNCDQIGLVTKFEDKQNRYDICQKCQSITVHPISLVIKSNFQVDLIHIHVFGNLL